MKVHRRGISSKDCKQHVARNLHSMTILETIKIFSASECPDLGFSIQKLGAARGPPWKLIDDILSI